MPGREHSEEKISVGRDYAKRSLKESFREAKLEDGFNGFFPSFKPSLFCISGILFFTDWFFVALSLGMRVVESVMAGDKKHFMDLTFFLALLEFV